MSPAPVDGPAHTRRRPRLLLHPGLSRKSADARLDYFTTISRYGTKVAGLQILPPAWVPPYIALPASIYEDWAEEPKSGLGRLQRRLNLEQTAALVSDRGRHAMIVRSSAVGEGLDDRGLYRSIRLANETTIEQIASAIEEIFRHFATQGRHSAMGICLQRYVQPEFAGHASNEVRLSATRNQWKYGLEKPTYVPERGINSKFAVPPDENLPLSLASQNKIKPVLRQLCHWVNMRVGGRSHLEWCAASGRLWLVQLDQESPTSAGINPHTMPTVRMTPDLKAYPTSDATFQPYRIQDDSPWRKLRNLRDFWTSIEPPRHRLFYAPGDVLAMALARYDGTGALAAEIDALTGGRAVLRTDCKDPNIEPFNLPRTHTVDGSTASSWIGTTLQEMRSKGVATDDVAIILHRYIPARAAAWTYYSPGDDFVRIDCLWGLPDGLQFLSHDSFQVDARTGAELAAEVRYKPDSLQEQEDGAWHYVPVARQFGRDRVLSRDALRALALETVAVAHKIKARTQIMWFCDLPSELGLGQHLPWYRSKEFAGFEPAQRPPFPTRRARNLNDLAALECDPGRFIILAAPEVELVRDDNLFLDRVIALARARGLPIELTGSILGHAYYRLRAAGVLVLVPQPKYPRVRGRRRHLKLVRDAIPQNIAAKGERVSFARLAPSEALIALIGKLFEEGLEFNAARSPGQQLEELADVFEVVRGLAATARIDWEALVSAAAEKREKRGGFEQQTVLLETARPMPDRAALFKVAEDDNQPSIQLRDLGVVTVDGSGASISFSKLLSHGSTEVELLIDGRSINVTATLEGTGVHLVGSVPKHVENESSAQLGLFEDAPDEDPGDTAPQA